MDFDEETRILYRFFVDMMECSSQQEGFRLFLMHVKNHYDRGYHAGRLDLLEEQEKYQSGSGRT